jgi:hypothetical protein
MELAIDASASKFISWMKRVKVEVMLISNIQGFSLHKVPFSIAAKLTHARYGTSSHAATRLTGLNATNDAAMANHSKKISANATPGRCSPKNSGVHAAFKTSCARNKPRGRRCAATPPRCQTNQAATAIMV